jgi:TRAP-type mannitol/chloroaromatic compound transport system substrate-binding protein
MDRRTFLTTTTAAAAASLTTPAGEAAATHEALPSPALGNGAKHLRLSAAWAADVPVFGTAAVQIAQRVIAALGDRYRIEVTAGDEAAPLQLHEGAADLHFGPGDALIAQEPGMAYFAGMPGSLGLGAIEHQSWLLGGGGQMLWDDLAANAGLKPLLAGHTGSPGLWSSARLAGAADFAGATVAVSRSGRVPAELLGAKPVHWGGETVRDGLVRGSVLAAAWGNPLASLALGFDGSASHFYPTGLDPAGSAVVLSIRRPLWEAMSAGDRAVLEAVAAEAWSLSLAESRGHERIVTQVLEQRPSLAVGRLPSALRSAWDAAAQGYAHELAASSQQITRIHDSYMAWRRQLGLDGGPLA